MMKPLSPAPTGVPSSTPTPPAGPVRAPGCRDRNTGIVLLVAVEAERKLVVGGDVIKLGGRLVHLRGPGRAAIDGDIGAAVIAFDHALRIGRIDPQFVIVTMLGLQRLETLAAIGRTVERGVEYIHAIRILGIGEDRIEIPGPLFDAVLVADERPGLAAVIRAEEAAF